MGTYGRRTAQWSSGHISIADESDRRQPPERGGERVAVLDALRFVAAASVMLYHYTYLYPTGGDLTLSPIGHVTRHGYLGVDLFFMISGFVILWSAVGRSASRFVRARLLRLYPEFWIAVAVSAAVFALRPGGFGSELDASVIARNLTMVPQYLGAPYVDGVYWTLGVELKFYFLVLVLILARQLARREWWLYGWMTILAVATVADVGGAVRSLTLFPYGALFASGGLFYLVFSNGWTATRALALLVGLVLSSWHAVGGMDRFIDEVHITSVAKASTVAVITAAFGVFALLTRIQLPAGIAASAATIGGLTYPLYLLHNTGREVFLRNGAVRPYWLAVLLAKPFSIALSWMVMRLSARFVLPAFRRAVDRILGTAG